MTHFDVVENFFRFLTPSSTAAEVLRFFSIRRWKWKTPGPNFGGFLLTPSTNRRYHLKSQLYIGAGNGRPYL